GGPISRPASPPSAPSARCSRAISRSTRAAAATPRCGTPSSTSPPAAPPPKRRRCSPAQQIGFTDWIHLVSEHGIGDLLYPRHVASGHGSIIPALYVIDAPAPYYGSQYYGPQYSSCRDRSSRERAARALNPTLLERNLPAT